MSNAVVEPVVGLKVGVTSVPFRIDVPLGSKVRQEIVRFSRTNPDKISFGGQCKGIVEVKMKIGLDFRLKIFFLITDKIFWWTWEIYLC